MNAKSYKPRYIDEWISASLIEEQRSNIDNKQYIYFPLADLSDDDIEIVNQAQKTESQSKCMSFSISSISGLGHRDNILQHSKIIVRKNLEPVPEKWLELYISGLLQYPDANDTFEILDKNDQKVCIYRFIEDYVRGNWNLSGYVANAIFYKIDREVSDQLKNLEEFDRKRCKTLSLSCNLDIMDIKSSSDEGNRNGNGNENSDSYRLQYTCYHSRCDFHTDSEQAYQSHGALKHPKNPLLYPSKAEIEKYGLQAQGKDWER
jgi:hypothetical protein